MGATITVPGYPTTNRVPGVFFGLDPSGANTAQQTTRSLIVAPMLASGTAVPNVAVLVGGSADSPSKFGLDSVAAQMVADYRKQDSFGELWVLPIAQPSSGAAASGTVAIAGTATAGGTLSLYIAGQRVPVSVGAGDTAATIAADMAADIAAFPTLPCTAAATTGTVTLTAVDKSTIGADCDLELNLGGTAAGEATPPGITVTITPFSGGQTPGVITAGIANLGDKTFDQVISAFNDPTSRAAIAQLLNDQSGRWSWSQQIYGHAYYASRGTLGQLDTLGGTVNDQHATILGVNGTPWPMYRVVADLAGAVMASVRSDPALPLQNLPLNMPAPPLAARFDIGERNTLLYVGISTYKVNDFGQVFTDRLITTYQENAAGVPDDSYLDLETMTTLMFLLRDMHDFLATNYARKKLVADGTVIPGGSNMCTSQTVLASARARYRTYCTMGLAQNPDNFDANSRGENAGNGNVSLLLPLDLANQLRDIAGDVNFLKS